MSERVLNLQPQVTTLESGVPVAESKPITHSVVLQRATGEHPLIKWSLITLATLFLALFLLAPLAIVFSEAFKKGFEVYRASLVEPDALAAIKLTLLTAAIAVPVNTLFGLSAAWAIANFHFRGKSLLLTLIDLPFAVSPVIAGLIFVLLLRHATAFLASG